MFKSILYAGLIYVGVLSVRLFMVEWNPAAIMLISAIDFATYCAAFVVVGACIPSFQNRLRLLLIVTPIFSSIYPVSMNLHLLTFSEYLQTPQFIGLIKIIFFSFLGALASCFYLYFYRSDHFDEF